MGLCPLRMFDTKEEASPILRESTKMCDSFSPEVLQLEADETTHHDHQEGGVGIGV